MYIYFIRVVMVLLVCRNRTNKLQINNIVSHVPWDEVRELFNTFGNVLQCDRGKTVLIKFDVIR